MWCSPRWGGTADSADFDPDQLTRETGIEPDITWRVGDARRIPGLRNVPPASKTVWRLREDAVEPEGLHKVLGRLFERMRPGWPALIAFVRHHRAMFEAIVVLGSSEWPLPAVTMTPDDMARMAERGAGFGVDIFDYRGKDSLT
jgi:hypothetical protein